MYRPLFYLIGKPIPSFKTCLHAQHMDMYVDDTARRWRAATYVYVLLSARRTLMHNCILFLQ